MKIVKGPIRKRGGISLYVKGGRPISPPPKPLDSQQSVNKKGK